MTSAAPTTPAWQRELSCVGVTGTNGKTTTTTWIARALRALGDPVARVTTLGFFLDDEHVELDKEWHGFVEGFARLRAAGGRHAAVEYTSHALGRGMAALWPAKVAVFTNFTRDHLDHHGSPEHYLACKAQLFRELLPGGVAVLNAADPASELLCEVVPEGCSVLRYAVASRGEHEGDVDLRARSVDVSWDGTHVIAEGRERVEIAVQPIGEVYAENALAAYLAATAAGVPREAVLSALAATPAPPGRFEVVSREPGVVVDFAHTPDALERTLAAARRVASGRVIVLFGAGGERDTEKRPLMGRAARTADRVVLTSDNPRSEAPAVIAAMIREGLGDHANVVVELDRARAIRSAVATLAAGDVLVIAGKGHEETQEAGGVVRPFSDRAIALAALGR